MSSVVNGIQAALLLARGRPDGLELLSQKPVAAMRAAALSFWAMAFAIPGFVALHVMDWVMSGKPSGVGRGFAQDLLGFVIGWLAFALLSHRVAEITGRAALWPRFITAWNWCNVIQYLMLVSATLPGLLGLPAFVGQMCWLVAIFWAVWLEFFTTRLALASPVKGALAMVALDFGLGIAIAFIIAGFN